MLPRRRPVIAATAALGALAVATALLLPTAPGSAAPGATTSAASASSSSSGRDCPRQPVTELVGQYDHLPPVPGGQANLAVTCLGFRYRASYDDNRLTITATERGLRFADRAADAWENLPSVCRRVPTRTGIAASCRIPAAFLQGRLFVEVWPKLGDDHVDGGSLPPKYRMWALTDDGRDKIVLGRGADFANGAFKRDVVFGGPGDDWIRVGEGRNAIYGGPGDDRLIGGDGPDTIRGGDGEDFVGGLEGGDRLLGDEGRDGIKGGPGRDLCHRQGPDRIRECERVLR